MDDRTPVQAIDCIENLRLNSSPAEFGYKIQALAAHVLLRLGFEIESINRSGHPDIVAVRGIDKIHFEVEAEVTDPRPRQLTSADFAALTDLSDGIGYFALAVSFPTPRWVVVPAESLRGRGPCSNVLMEALSDADLCDSWTNAYMSLLSQECRRIRRASFRELCERALSGRGL